jgi:hypothetical protein
MFGSKLREREVPYPSARALNDRFPNHNIQEGSFCYNEHEVVYFSHFVGSVRNGYDLIIAGYQNTTKRKLNFLLGRCPLLEIPEEDFFEVSEALRRSQRAGRKVRIFSLDQFLEGRGLS